MAAGVAETWSEASRVDVSAATTRVPKTSSHRCGYHVTVRVGMPEYSSLVPLFVSVEHQAQLQDILDVWGNVFLELWLYYSTDICHRQPNCYASETNSSLLLWDGLRDAQS